MDSKYNSSDFFHSADGILFGLSYIRVITPHFQFETGAYFSRNKFEIDKTIPRPNTEWSRIERKEIVSIPFSLVLVSQNAFYISFGPQIDFEVNHWTRLLIQNQSGIGLNLAVGKTLHLADNFYLSLSPTAKIHNIVPFQSEIKNIKAIEFGFQVSLTYGFLQ